MVVDRLVPPFVEWLLPAALGWLLVVGIVTGVVLVGVFLFEALRKGPGSALRTIYRALRELVLDLVGMSPRRVFALAWLAVQEALRREVWVGLAVFLCVLGFAGWFLEPKGGDPARLYVSFVLSATTILVLLLALVLSAFSLPNDMAKKTIYTVVTKPVRSSEIVLGRILGFTAVGTGLLAIICVLSCVFVERQLVHTHSIDPADVTQEKEGAGIWRGKTSRDADHLHEFTVDSTGQGQTDIAAGHWHVVTMKENGGKRTFEVGPPQDMPVARVPVYGKLRFKDPAGADTLGGVNVGDEWGYREFIEGGTAAAAIWTFTGITEEQFPDGLPLQARFEIFRSYKGEVEKGIPGEIVLRNPATQLEHIAAIFTPREHTIHSEFIPRQLVDASSGRNVDLFKDLVADGALEVQIRCVPPGQYYGMAQADLYLVARQAWFRMNFVKGYVGIWLQMVIIIAFGVMFSTFLNGAVAALATLATLAGGFFLDFMSQLASGKLFGGGPLESMIRLLTQRDMMTELEPGTGVTLATTGDKAFQGIMFVVVRLLPSWPDLSDVDWVAYGYDIPLNNILVHGVTAAAYLAPVFLIAYLFLKTREVAK
jgi:hypothetical protein